MFIVLVQGALVTTTGSGEGCGKSWPLCNGRFVPSYAIESAIEYSHRFVAGIETILIVGAGIGIWRYWRRRTEIKVFVPLMVGFLVVQALLGAAAVMWPQTPEIMALHFGISLVAFASVLLAAIFIYEQGNWDKLRDRPIPNRFRYLVFGLIGYTYAVVYLGAYVRHKDVSLACTDWPLCNGSVFPGFTGPVGIVFGHRISALLTVFMVGLLVAWAMRLRDSRPDLFWASMAAGVLVVLQSLSGAFVVWTRLDIFATMSHGMFMSLFFGALSYLCLHVLPRPKSAFVEAEQGETGAQGRTAPLPGNVVLGRGK